MSFTYLFYQHIMFRHSCGKCHFTNTKRPSDITLADFWGWEKTSPDFNKDNKGVSLILVNTEKGRKLFEEASKDMNIIPAKLEDCIQPNLMHPTSINPKYIEFENDYVNNGFEYVLKKYDEHLLLHNLKKVARKLKCIVNNFIEKR